MRAALFAALLSAAAVSAAAVHADEVTGTVALWDAATGTMTMTDRTVWLLGDMAPAALAPGQRVTVLYRTAGEDGITGIDAVSIRGPEGVAVAPRS